MKLMQKYATMAWKINPDESYEEYPAFIQAMFHLGQLSWGKDAFHNDETILLLSIKGVLVNTAQVGYYILSENNGIEIYNEDYIKTYYNEVTK